MNVLDNLGGEKADKTQLAIFILIFSILLLHLHFSGEESLKFIRIIRVYYIPTCLSIYIAEIYYLKSILSKHHIGLFVLLLCILGIIFKKIIIRFESNERFMWFAELIMFHRFEKMFTLVLPLSLASTIMNFYNLVLGLP